jgi:hypothetical protein
MPLLEQTWWKAAAKEAGRPRCTRPSQKLSKVSSLPPVGTGGRGGERIAAAEELLEPPEL